MMRCFLAFLLCFLVVACASTKKETAPRSTYQEGAIAPTYRVQKGDSISKIAQKKGVSVANLSKWNGIKPPYRIHPGQVLYLGPPTMAQRSGVSGGGHGKTITQKQDIAPPPNVRRSEKFMWPVKGALIASFGQKDGGQQNDGINIAASQGTKIRAADGGKVAYVGNEVKGFGNLVLIRHDSTWVTAYAHTDKILVKKGETVDRGENIATVGQTGSVTRPQLHFETRYKGRPVDPLAQME